eukprot:scaffold1724_cov341-Pavlova_lutheri.AAC.90
MIHEGSPTGFRAWLIKAPRLKPRGQRPPNPSIKALVRLPAFEFGGDWAREAHGEAWSGTWYDGVVLHLLRLPLGEQEAICCCHTSRTSTEEWPVTKERCTVTRLWSNHKKTNRSARPWRK